jgi:hypothetical protein
VLLYSCEPLKHSQVYLKYPYVFYESLIPLCLFMFYANPLGLDYYTNYLNILAVNSLWWPRVQYWKSLQYKPRRLWLLRGGKVLKVEMSSVGGDRFTAWVETKMFHPLTKDNQRFDDRNEAEFLTEEGQLKYELTCQLDHFTQMGVTQQDELLTFMKEGVIHHPELFEASVKGYNIDTSDFTINTAHNLRAMEGHDNV